MINFASTATHARSPRSPAPGPHVIHVIAHVPAGGFFLSSMRMSMPQPDSCRSSAAKSPSPAARGGGADSAQGNRTMHSATPCSRPEPSSGPAGHPSTGSGQALLRTEKVLNFDGIGSCAGFARPYEDADNLSPRRDARFLILPGWWLGAGSNRRPQHYECRALTV